MDNVVELSCLYRANSVVFHVFKLLPYHGRANSACVFILCIIEIARNAQLCP